MELVDIKQQMSVLQEFQALKFRADQSHSSQVSFKGACQAAYVAPCSFSYSFSALQKRKPNFCSNVCWCLTSSEAPEHVVDSTVTPRWLFSYTCNSEPKKSEGAHLQELPDVWSQHSQDRVVSRLLTKLKKHLPEQLQDVSCVNFCKTDTKKITRLLFFCLFLLSRGQLFPSRGADSLIYFTHWEKRVMSLTKNFTGGGNQVVCFGIFVYDSNQELTLDIKLSLPPGKQGQVITQQLLGETAPWCWVLFTHSV